MPKALARKREFEKTENGVPTSTALGEVMAICGPPDLGLQLATDLVLCGDSLCHLKATTPNSASRHDGLDDIIAYHDRTKHHPERYANGPPIAAGRSPRHATCGCLVRRGDSSPQPLTLERLSLYLELS